jgi:hypothetical protein
MVEAKERPRVKETAGKETLEEASPKRKRCASSIAA